MKQMSMLELVGRWKGYVYESLLRRSDYTTSRLLDPFLSTRCIPVWDLNHSEQVAQQRWAVAKAGIRPIHEVEAMQYARRLRALGCSCPEGGEMVISGAVWEVWEVGEVHAMIVAVCENWHAGRVKEADCQIRLDQEEG